jgi:hypothetical protein
MNAVASSDQFTPSARRRTVRNTRDTTESLLFLADALGSHNPSDAILRQEADGQRSLVNSDTLPTDIGKYDRNGESRAALEAFGVVFGEMVEGDPLFQYVTLPDGWKKVSTDHSMWSNLVDEQGRIRAQIFYKAAFYDRSASLSVCRRFSAGLDYTDATQEERDHSQFRAIVTDGGETVIYRSEPIGERRRKGDREYAGHDEAQRIAQAWLAEHYPDWESLTAYWDDDSAQNSEGQV